MGRLSRKGSASGAKRLRNDTIAAGRRHTVAVQFDGTVTAVGFNKHDQCNVGGWRDIVAVAAGCAHTVGLKSNGTVVAVGDNDDGQCDVSGWSGIQLPCS